MYPESNNRAHVCQYEMPTACKNYDFHSRSDSLAEFYNV